MTASNRPSIWQPALVFGFAGALAMWVCGFVARLPAIQAPPGIIADLFAIVQITTGAIAGGLLGARGGLATGAASGLVSGLINLLILGSLLSDPAKINSLRSEWHVPVAAFLLGLPLLGLVGAGAGRAMRSRGAPGPNDAPATNWHGWFSAVTAGATLTLLITGGLVTSLNAGLAVVDWPNSFGFNMLLYPLSQMQGGRYFEHAHRLFGMLVGLTSLTLVFFTFRAGASKKARGVAAFAFVLVASQGVLGGQRVTLTNTTLAFVHGITGQVIFALLCVLACMSSARWKSADADDAAGSFRPIAGAPRVVAASLFLLLLVQLALGAAARHFDQSRGYLHIVATHGVNALIVTGLAVAAGAKAGRTTPLEPTLRRAGKAVMHAAFLQVLLGALTLVAVLQNRNKPPALFDTLSATAHQTIGALLLGCSAMLLAWTRRLSTPAN